MEVRAVYLGSVSESLRAAMLILLGVSSTGGHRRSPAGQSVQVTAAVNAGFRMIIAVARTDCSIMIPRALVRPTGARWRSSKSHPNSKLWVSFPLPEVLIIDTILCCELLLMEEDAEAEEQENTPDPENHHTCCFSVYSEPTVIVVYKLLVSYSIFK